MIYSSCLIFLVMFSIVYTSAQNDLVTNEISIYKEHKWYSGYLNFTMGDFHYVFFQSQRDPQHDPLVLWLNGGPGCSSLIGMVYQNGPFTFITNTSSFQLNQYSWNKKANLLYIQSPGGVGFSIGRRSNINTDATVAQDNLQAIIAFYLTKFPNLKNNQFYIAGQSYSGIYIPYLAYQILKYNKEATRFITIPLKGIMIGNGCTDPRQCFEPGSDDALSIYQYEFLYHHNFISEDDYNQMRGSCILSYNGTPCRSTRERLDKNYASTNTSMLNIYQPCYARVLHDQKWKIYQNGRIIPTDNVTFIDCDDLLGIRSYFNGPLIPTHLHVNFVSNFQECSDQVALNYQMFENASYWLYPLLLKEDLRIWVYSGDVDANVPITGTLNWLSKLKQEMGLPAIELWREWWVSGLHQHEDQVGGMTWKLKNLTFASIRGAGHMVPKDKRKESYVLFDSFKNGVDLPYHST